MPTRSPVHPGRKPTPLIRKNSHQRGYGGKDWEETRKRILKRDKWTCQMCQAPLYSKGSKPNVDHKISKENGGSEEDSNLWVLCPSCHSKKGAKTDGLFGNPRIRI